MTQKKSKRSEEYRVVPVDEDGNELDTGHFTDSSHFASFDLGLSAALISVGYSLVSLDRGDLRKTRFIFRRADGMDEVIDAYWADRLEVKARTYFDTQKMLKNRLYSE